MRAAEKLREAITSPRIAIPAGADLSVSASFGVACYGPDFPGEVKDMEGLLKRIDEALYKAKTNGRNRVEMVQKDDNTHADKVRAY